MSSGWRERRVAEIREELEDHIRRRTESLVKQGWVEDAARAEAERRLGDAAGIEAACIEAAERRRLRRRIRGIVEGARRDVVHALRGYGRRPLFAGAAILTTALALGAATAVFGIVNGIVLKPLPYGSPERVYSLYNQWEGSPSAQISPAEYFDYLDGTESVLDGLGVFALGAVNVELESGAERVRTAGVSAGVWPAVGVEPVLGRLSTPEEEAAGAYVVVISNGYWQRRFGGQPDAIGQTLRLNGTDWQVIGVLPPGFRLPGEFQAGAAADLYTQMSFSRTSTVARGSHYLSGLARLAPGVTRTRAEEVLATVTASFVERFPDDYPRDMRFGSYLLPVTEDVVGAVRPVLRVLFGAVMLVLLIACANVAGLVLVRSVSRSHEFALRDALGAGSGALARQVLAENAVLALAGGVLGVGLATAALRGFVALDPPGLPRVESLAIDDTVLWFAFGLIALAAVLFSLAPLAVRRSGLAAVLRESGRSAGGSPRADRLRRFLVAGQLALALVLLAGAGLLGRSLVALLAVDPGYSTTNVITTRIGLPVAGYLDDSRSRDFFSGLIDRVRSSPGVQAVGAVTNLPLDSRLGDINIRIEGREVREGEVAPKLDWQVVTPGWFDAMGIRVLRGRGIETIDDERASGAVVLNESAVRLHFPDEDPLGRRFLLGGDAGPGWVTVVGIVNDVRQSALGEPPTPSMYLAHRQFTYWNGGRAVRGLTLVASVSGDPLALVPVIRREIADLDPTVAPGPFRTMEQVLSGSLTTPRFALAVVAVFALVALVLATVGIYGVVSWTAQQRTREVGIRMALGARRPAVLGLVLRQSVVPVGAGLGAGLVAALILPRALGSMLFGVTPTDPATLLAVSVGISAVALLASLLPARRATRVDPVTVLRSE